MPKPKPEVNYVDVPLPDYGAATLPADTVDIPETPPVDSEPEEKLDEPIPPPAEPAPAVDDGAMQICGRHDKMEQK